MIRGRSGEPRANITIRVCSAQTNPRVKEHGKKQVGEKLDQMAQQGQQEPEE